jgi:hypothetical protein
MTMKLPYPFQSARGLEPDALGRIALIDEGGKVLAHLPLATAHELTPERSGPGWGCGDGLGYGDFTGFGRGSGDSYGDGFNSGSGVGDRYGNGDGSGKK